MNGENLPYQALDVVPFTPITSEWGDGVGYDILALAAGTGLDDGAIDTPKIAHGAVTPDNLLAGTGSSWDWGSWEPVVAGGGGQSVAVSTLFFAEYKVIGKTCFYRFRAALILSGAEYNEFTISLPVPRENPGVTATIGGGYIIGGGVDGSACFVYSSQATNSVVRLYNSSVHTNGTGRQINITGFYPAA